MNKTETPTYNTAEHVVLRPMFRLRWVERGGPWPDKIVPVLQQAWQDDSTRAITWRDVPVEQE
jgi:hypothetical protein